MDTSFKERYIKARREMIARDFSSLNPQQKEAVMTVSGPLLILAGAGSGKTTVVINRVINLLRYGLASESDFVPSTAREEDIALFEAGPSEEAIKLAAVSPVKPWRVLAITFTNKAAGELRDRLEKAIGPEASDIWAQTFHSACVRILRRDADRLGFSKSFTIYDTSDMQSVVKHILSDNGIDEKNFPPRAVLSEISKAKDSLLSVDEFQEEANASGDRRRMVVAGIYKEYMRRLRNADAMDFDDLIVNTIRLLEDNPDILSNGRDPKAATEAGEWWAGAVALVEG
ncbi:MAG: UvrD-helicase domain-containing protein, partial [Oscillospiraceae bacterium]|nr:UvrD-helicase domain-containing protein [Oscillospiraceae bacterium]